MKKAFISLFGSVLILSACSNDSSEVPVTEETAPAEEAAEENTETEDIAAADLINNAVEASNGITSYEARQSFNIEMPDSEKTSRTIMTHGDQNEFKLEINNDGEIITHYVVDGDHFIYQDNELINTDENLEVSNNDYQSIVSSLENYTEGEVNALDGGYALTINISDMSDLSGFIDDGTLSSMESAESITGTMQLYFDGDYKFTGSELTAEIMSADEEINIHSTVDYTRIDKVSVIEKPNNM